MRSLSTLEIFRVLCGVWLLAELVLARFAPGKPEEGRDRASLCCVWIAVFGAVGAGLLVGKTGVGSLGHPVLCESIGITLLLIGLAVRIAAVSTLRRFFTVHVTILPEHRLVTAGLYRRVRHPAYTGALVSVLGIAVAMNNWLAGIAVFVPIAAAFAYRMRVEEAALRARFGAEYDEYAARSWRLVPGLY
jgi:protein-S-isoprenylcysteine O-methyltransferase Ste14